MLFFYPLPNDEILNLKINNGIARMEKCNFIQEAAAVCEIAKLSGFRKR